MAPDALLPGDVVLVDLRGDDKWRPSIVLQAPETVAPLIAVLCGTSKEREGHLLVDPKHRWGKVLKLRMPTYFNVDQIYVVARSRIRRTAVAKCPSDLFVKLQELAENARFEQIDVAG